MKNMSPHIYQVQISKVSILYFVIEYSITEPAISSQVQHVILFPTTKRQWQIPWPLSLELNTFIKTKTTLHWLPSRPLWASTSTHTSPETSLLHIPLLKTSHLLCPLGPRLWLEACGFTHFNTPGLEGATPLLWHATYQALFSKKTKHETEQ